MGATQVPILDKFIKKQWSIHTPEHYSAIKKNGILPFATAWMDLEGVMLSEISQSENNKYDFMCMWNLKSNINEQTKQKQTHR